MTHFSLRPVLAAAAVTMAFAGPALATPAFAGTFTVELAETMSTNKDLVAESKVWDCEGTTCSTQLDRKKVSVRTCKKIAKRAGTVVSFKNGKSELTAEQIAECNTAVRK